MNFALVSQSKLSAVTPAVVQAFALLAGAQQRAHFASAWGYVPANIFLGLDPKKLPPSTIAAYLLDDPDVANAGGYHDVDPHGKPYIRVFITPYLDNGGSLMGSADSVLGALTHEMCETVLDADAGDYTQMPDGRLVSREACDPVQDGAYPIALRTGQKGYVSNFLLPAWFSARSAGPYDYLHRLTAPFTKTTGGYWIVQDSSGNAYDEFGIHVPEWKRELKMRTSARLARRLGPVIV